MTIIPFPTRTTRRYGDGVVTEAVAFEDERGDDVHDVASRLVAGDELSLIHI